ncbi:F-box-like/WD repeat-containing protein TBL1XR1 [Ceratobasidium sp. AG-Ba]|nr:F-box-like/WD repeat-containing protein TBL1XR1 [Ceratobasidium sp. AG-Ba]
MVPESQLNISSDETHTAGLNLGFQHTAFCLRQEARLDVSPNAKVHIPRGGLVTLLQKALLYIEVETHWRRDPSAAACSSPFSLLSAHVCSSSGITPASPGGTPRADKTNGKAADKRRMSPKSASRGQKRARLENLDTLEKESTPVSSRGAPASTDKSKKSAVAVAKTKPRKEPEPELEPLVLLKGHTAEVFVVAWNPNIPNLLATGGKDATVRIWNIPDNAKEPIFPSRICMHLPASPNCDITTITWNSDGSLLATGSYDGIVRVWTYRGELFTVLTQHQGPIFSIKWNKNGLLLTGSLDDSTIVWDVENGGKAKQRFTRHRDGCLDVEWLDGDYFASCGTDRNIFVEHIGDTAAVARLAGHQDEINQIKYQSDFKLLASGSDDYCACIWNLSDLNEDMFKTGPEEPVKPRPEVRRPQHTLRGHSGEVANLSWQPRNGRDPYEPVLVTSSFDGTVRMWNGITGACLSVFPAGCGKVCGHSFTPTGDLIAIVAGGKLILAKNGKEFFSWEDERNLYETAWRVDGKMVAAATESHQIVVINTKALKIPEDEPEDSSSGQKVIT